MSITDVIDLLPPHIQAKMNMVSKGLHTVTHNGLVSEIKALFKGISLAYNYLTKNPIKLTGLPFAKKGEK